jgi:hypothetical protein
MVLFNNALDLYFFIYVFSQQTENEGKMCQILEQYCYDILTGMDTLEHAMELHDHLIG